jgi:hypothetical protein
MNAGSTPVTATSCLTKFIDESALGAGFPQPALLPRRGLVPASGARAPASGEVAPPAASALPPVELAPADPPVALPPLPSFPPVAKLAGRPPVLCAG